MFIIEFEEWMSSGNPILRRMFSFFLRVLGGFMVFRSVEPHQGIPCGDLVDIVLPSSNVLVAICSRLTVLKLCEDLNANAFWIHSHLESCRLGLVSIRVQPVMYHDNSSE